MGEEHQGRQSLCSYLMVLPVQKHVVSNPFAYLSISCLIRPSSARSSLELTVKPVWGAGCPQVGLGWMGQASLCCQGGRAELLAHLRLLTLHSCLPGSRQGAKEIFELLSFTALFLASRGKKQGGGDWSRLSEGIVLHQAGDSLQSQERLMFTRKQNSFSRDE